MTRPLIVSVIEEYPKKKVGHIREIKAYQNTSKHTRQGDEWRVDVNGNHGVFCRIFIDDDTQISIRILHLQTNGLKSHFLDISDPDTDLEAALDDVVSEVKKDSEYIASTHPGCTIPKTNDGR